MFIIREFPEIYLEYAMMSDLSHIQMSTYTPGMGKPVPLTSFGIGGSVQEEAKKKSASYLRALEFAKKQDREILGRDPDV